jgi:hypothetical protein
MIDNRTAVDVIERAHDAQPFCRCGRHTTLIDRAGRIWLECSSLEERPERAIARVLASITSGAHTRELVLDLRPVAA